jgi:hypothetical protein
MFRLWKRIAATAGLAWSLIDKTGSNITDIETRNHADLQNINTAIYSHLSAADATDLTDGGESTLHYHASDRDSANFTGTDWDDLTDAGQSSLHGHPDSLINITTIGSVTDNVTVQDSISHAWSSGSVTGFELTDNGDGTINLAAGEAMLRPTSDPHDTLISMAVGVTANLALTDNSLNYVFVSYNAGTPIVQAGTSLTDFNCIDKCLIYSISREGTTLYWVSAGEQNIDSNRKHRRMLLECEGFRHVVGGSALGASGTRNFAITAGSFYYGLAKVTHDAFDTSAASTFKYYYRNGSGGWTTSTGNTQINNTQYDDGTGTLATLGNNNYGIHWVYLILDNPTIIAVQFGQDDYANIAAARAATVPAAPPTMQGIGALAGRIIIEKSAASFTIVESSFSQSFMATAATQHNGLAGLQGGAVSDYYHVTANEYGNIRSSLWAFAAAQG